MAPIVSTHNKHSHLSEVNPPFIGAVCVSERSSSSSAAQICIFFHPSITPCLKQFLRFSQISHTARFPHLALTLKAALHLIPVPSKAGRGADRTRTTKHGRGGDQCLSEGVGAAVGDTFIVWPLECDLLEGGCAVRGRQARGGYEAKAEKRSSSPAPSRPLRRPLPLRPPGSRSRPEISRDLAPPRPLSQLSRRGGGVACVRGAWPEPPSRVITSSQGDRRLEGPAGALMETSRL